MKIITKTSVKRLLILFGVLLTGYLLFSSFCCIIEVPPYVVKKPSRPDFVAGKYGKGELIFDPVSSEVPILILRGTPQEIGAQQGELLKPQLTSLIDVYLGRFLSKEGHRKRASDAMASMQPFVPAEYRDELEAMSKSSGLSFESLLTLHTIIDEPRLPWCSVIIASEPATKDRNIIFGRNLDFPSLGIARYYSIVVIYHPDNKKSFASVTWPGFIGVLSGINEDGLTLAMLVSFNGVTNTSGMPSLMLFRKVLEEASNIEEAVKIVGEAKRTAPTNLALADATGKSAVIEFTSDKIAVRYPEKGLLYSTNWFVSKEMKASSGDDRYDKMVKLAEKSYGEIGLTETIDILKAVPFPLINIQSMVISPRHKIVYLSSGSVPAAKGEFKRIDLDPYLKSK